MKILRELREKRGLTLEQVAEGVGLRNQYISNYELGKRRGLPRQANSRYMWGPQYTFYVSRTGEVFHRNARCGKASLFSVHAVYLGDRRPCKICKPMRPDMSWFMPYFNAKNNIKTLPSKKKEGNRPGHDYWLRVEVGKDLGGKPIFEEITAPPASTKTAVLCLQGIAVFLFVFKRFRRFRKY